MYKYLPLLVLLSCGTTTKESYSYRQCFTEDIHPAYFEKFEGQARAFINPELYSAAVQNDTEISEYMKELEGFDYIYNYKSIEEVVDKFDAENLEGETPVYFVFSSLPEKLYQSYLSQNQKLTGRKKTVIHPQHCFYSTQRPEVQKKKNYIIFRPEYYTLKF